MQNPYKDVKQIVEAQVSHIEKHDQRFLKSNINYLRNVIITAAQILEKNEKLWGWSSKAHTNVTKPQLSFDEARSLFVMLITAAAKVRELDTDAIVYQIDFITDQSLDFVGALDALIKSCSESKIDFPRFFRIIELAGMTQELFFTDMCSHLALRQFRIERGYMGVTPGNYIHIDEHLQWNDEEFATISGRSIGLKADTLFMVHAALCEGYDKTVKNMRI
ncbi:hypothetical protein [Cellvibrio sp. QJXJ]|uniref:hypothetical protein n=1 Tax=Cellvibrio sp. QJXJ TaxID=2964606 RepID=UPI0021C311D2|nr:hypothetical protein [Cellvibrio sp. QJXJ]UUA75165.1 hypothetical protein NNX04_22165 [Cellvibrio sp. QJXJ]